MSIDATDQPIPKPAASPQGATPSGGTGFRGANEEPRPDRGEDTAAGPATLEASASSESRRDPPPLPKKQSSRIAGRPDAGSTVADGPSPTKGEVRGADQSAAKRNDRAEEDETPSRWQRTLALIVGFVGAGYGVSLLLHGVLLLILSILILEETGNLPFATSLAFSGQDESEVIDVLDTKIDSPESQAEELDFSQLEQFSAVPADIPLPEFNTNAVTNAGESTGDGDGGTGMAAGGGLKFSVPSDGRAVNKGSFTAWTVPEDPAPLQPYLIVIEIALPEDTKRYRASDLSGFVDGSDHYRQRIPFDPLVRGATKVQNKRGGFRTLRPRGILPIIDGRTQLIVGVPGGDMTVKDTIVIESKLLKEKQELVITF